MISVTLPISLRQHGIIWAPASKVVTDWLHDNLELSVWHIDWGTSGETIIFYNDSDAILFKMRWVEHFSN